MKKKLAAMVIDWTKLYQYYDKDHNGMLSKDEVKQMLVDTGFKQITDAEASFVMNNLARFERTISPQGFEKWAAEMARLTPKRLIYYSAYLDTAKMEIRTDRDFVMR